MGDLEDQEEKITKKLRPIEKINIHNIKTALAKMELLAPEIKLTDEEVVIIIYTSIDH